MIKLAIFLCPFKIDNSMVCVQTKLLTVFHDVAIQYTKSIVNVLSNTSKYRLSCNKKTQACWICARLCVKSLVETKLRIHSVLPIAKRNLPAFYEPRNKSSLFCIISNMTGIICICSDLREFWNLKSECRKMQITNIMAIKLLDVFV